LKGDGYDNIFVIKYDKNGNHIWSTKLATLNDNTNNVSTIVDSNKNIYLTCVSNNYESYIFDTTNKTEPVLTTETKIGENGIILLKYDSDGVLKWYNQIDGVNYKYDPILSIDNRFIQGEENSTIYLAGVYESNINFYNSDSLVHIAYTLDYSEFGLYNGNNCFLSAFDQDGKFSWATKVAMTDTDHEGFGTPSVTADKYGHVYLLGNYDNNLYIYDAQNNETNVAVLKSSDIYDHDIFIIKYNRYGILDSNLDKSLYIEDNEDLPDSFCKQIIISNNENNGIVNLQILHKNNYGYSVRRTISISEALELITRNGLWIPKIISEQYTNVEDLDVIDINTKTSFVNFDNLQNTFYTSISGDNNELNPQLSIDKYDNVYMAGVFQSDELNIYDGTNNTIPVSNLYIDGDQSLFLTKYDSSGKNLWRTKVGGYYTKTDPSVYTAGNGDTFVCMQSSEDDDNIKIYDVNNVNDPVKELPSYSGDDNTIIIKYNNNGKFIWNVRILSTYDDGNPTFTSSAVVSGDINGNLYVCGYFDGNELRIYDTSSDEDETEVFTLEDDTPSYFIIKFDYIGKFLWVNRISGDLIPSNEYGSPDYIKFFQIKLNVDNNENLYLSSIYYDTLTIYNIDGSIFDQQFSLIENGLKNFNIKYNKDGNPIWMNKILANSGSFPDGLLQCDSCIDYIGNLYTTLSGFNTDLLYIYDTRKYANQPIHQYELNTSVPKIFIVKFNPNGVFQWTTYIDSTLPSNEEIDSIVFSPKITCDNRFTHGVSEPAIYLQLTGYADDYRSGINFRDADYIDNIAYTLPTKEYWMEDYTVHSVLSKFNTQGKFQWATTAAGYTYYEEGIDVSSTSVKTDSKGHVYISGHFYNYDLYIWDVSTNGYNDNELARINNNGNFDIFLIKYNRYGLLNTNVNNNIYIEDSSDIPNAFEKSIVITNNINNGIVNCNILEPLSVGYGYTVRRNISLTDTLDLICYKGQWIPKIAPTQLTISNENDVININTNLTMLDYNVLNYSAFTSSINGSGDEQNVRITSDKNSNIYVLFSYTTNSVSVYNFYEYSNSYYKFSNRDLGIVKYNNNGEISWFCHLGFDSDFTGNPSIFSDEEGNIIVTLVKNTDIYNSISVFESKDQYNSIKSININSSSTVTIKFDKDGLYLWDVSVASYYNSNSETSDSLAVSDSNGNVYISGYLMDGEGAYIIDSSGNGLDRLYTDGNGMFLVQFDKTGKYSWSVPIYNGIETESKCSLAVDRDGNVIITGLMYDTVSVYNLIEKNIIFYKDFDKPTGYAASLILKYDNTGRCLWATKLGATEYYYDGYTYLPVSEIDADGNFYLAVQVAGGSIYIYDTRNESDYRFSVSIPNNTEYNTFFAKYNKNGIIQWYNFISGYNSLPSISIDKTFISSSKTNNICISGTYTGDDEFGNIYLYNAANNGDSPYTEATLTSNNEYSFVAKFDDSGHLLWCSKVGGSLSEINSCVHCTADGHVYLGGDFIGDNVDVYQGWTAGMDPNVDVSTTIYNDNPSTFDIFLVKYNRYGIVNNSNPRLGRECYIHNDISVPDGTEKTIVVKNNYVSSQLQQILLITLNYNYTGYSIDRTIFLSEGITLVSYGGKWFVKSSSSNDALPKKSIVMWGGNQNDIPFGWALCDGQTYNNILTPDLRGRFVLGYNNDVAGVNGASTNGGQTTIGTNARVDYTLCNTVGNIGGEVLHTLTEYEMPTHNHGVTDPGHTHSVYQNTNNQDTDNAFATETAADDNDIFTNTGSNTTGITINNTGGGQPHNNIPPFYVLCYIMKCY